MTEAEEDFTSNHKTTMMMDKKKLAEIVPRKFDGKKVWETR